MQTSEQLIVFRFFFALNCIALQNPGTYQFVDPSHPVQPTPEQLEKLRKELDIVNNNLKVLNVQLFPASRFSFFFHIFGSYRIAASASNLLGRLSRTFAFGHSNF